MALGGGTFITQNKVLPGAYINFVSAARASTSLSSRGIAAMALELDWGPDGQVFTVTNGDFQKNSKKIFGYDYTSEKLKGLRDLFRNITTLHAYKLNTGAKASNTYATAKYSGVRGNDLKIVVQANADDESKFDVTTVLGSEKLDSQTAATAAELKPNDFVDWKPGAVLAVTAGLPLTGGTNGEAVTGAEYQSFLDKIESYSFNTLGCLSTEAAVVSLFTAFTKRMRDECGVKFQTVVYRGAADHEGVISVENKTTDSGWPESSLIYWITGAEAGIAVNRDNSNRLYDGEFIPAVDYTQTQLESGIKSGKLMLHKVGGDIRILTDINTLVSVTEQKNSDFQSNQTVRVLDQIGNDIAVLFNTKYLGSVPNDASGRISLWNDIVSHHRQLETLRAIQDFKADDVVVTAGDTKKSVVVTDAVTPVNCMQQLYMTVTVE